MNLYTVFYETNDGQVQTNWNVPITAEDVADAFNQFKAAYRTSGVRPLRAVLVEENYQGINMYTYQFSGMQQQAQQPSTWQSGNTYQTYVFQDGTYVIR